VERPEKITIGFVIYPGFNALDLVGPHEILSRLNARFFLVSEKGGKVLSEKGIAVEADYGFLDCPSMDILVVTGGPGQMDMMNHPGLMTFLRNKEPLSRFVAAVCTGTLLLAAAGLLQGRYATTHWLAKEELVQYGAIFKAERVVFDGKFVTGAGVSSGIDLALDLVGKIAGSEAAQLIQLAIEYDPAPPFQSGSPEKAPSFLVDRLKRTSRFYKES
jgi:transcriptional regulator GlxA family with amidase domain